MEENYSNQHNKKERSHTSKVPDSDMETQEYRLIPIGEVVEDDSDEKLNLFHIATVLWEERKKILISVGVVFVIGLFIYKIKPRTFTADASLLPEIANNNRSGNQAYRQISNFLNLNSNSEGGSANLKISLYPKIVQSLPFELELIKQPLYFSTLDTTISIYTYYTQFARPSFYAYLKHYTIGSSALEAQMFVHRKKKADPTDTTVYSKFLNKKYILHTEGSRISVAVGAGSLINVENTPDDITKVSAHLPDPTAAADLVSATTQLLTKYVTNYRVNKAKNDEEFIQKQTDQARQKYIDSQNALDQFNDSHVNLVTAQAKSESERLGAQYKLAFNLYQNLAQQLDQAKIKVQQQTPVFSTLEPARIPSGRKDPSLKVVIVGSIFVGLFIGCGLIFLSWAYEILIEKWNTYRNENASGADA